MSKRYLIVGAGIIGSSIAREIASRRIGEVIVLEKEKELGLHASGRNSGVLHSGINQKPGSLKARMCVEGNYLARNFCKEYEVPMEECGTIVVAREQSELPTLDKLLVMGMESGVEGLKIIDKQELAERELNVHGIKALFSPNGAVVDSLDFLKKVSKDAVRNGAEYFFDEKVTSVINKKDKIIIETDKSEHIADHIVNCAGLYADEIAHKFGVGLNYSIIPFKGSYREVKNLRINSMVYQVPDLRYPFLGVHFTKTVDGKVLAGPTAQLAFGREAYNNFNLKGTIEMVCSRNFWNMASNREFLKLAYSNGKTAFFDSVFLEEARKICPLINERDLSPYRSGIRAQLVDKNGIMVDDMLVEFRENSTHVLNAVSPGMTCSLAFAKYVVDNMDKN